MGTNRSSLVSNFKRALTSKRFFVASLDYCGCCTPQLRQTSMANFKLQSGTVMASPNVIPMADIMLVLLIIFMVVTPMIRRGAPVDLAKVNNPIDLPNADKDDAVIVAISSDGTTFLGNSKTALDEISPRVSDLISGRLDKTVFIKSDARAKYGDVVKLVDQVRLAGAENVGLLTDKSDAIRRVLPAPATAN